MTSLIFYYWSVFKTENCFHNKINVVSRIRISSRTLNFEIFKPIIYRLKKFSKKVQRENRRLRKKYSKWQKPCMSEQMSDVEKLLLCDVKNKSSIAFWPANYLICLWRNGHTGLFSPSNNSKIKSSYSWKIGIYPCHRMININLRHISYMGLWNETSNFDFFFWKFFLNHMKKLVE